MKINYLFKVIIFLSLMLNGLQADENLKLKFTEANSAYSAAKFTKAITLYEKIIKSEFENGEIWYNLGNAYYKKGNLLKAIYSYEKAKKFIPGDTDLLKNIEICKLTLVDKSDKKVVLPIWKWLSNVRDIGNIYQNIFYALLFLLIVSVLISIHFFQSKKNFKKITISFIIIVTLLCLITTYFSYSQYQEFYTTKGFIVPKEVSIMSSPDENSNSVELFLLHQGTKVSIEKTLNGWTKISIDKKKQGWIQTDKLLEL